MGGGKSGVMSCEFKEAGEKGQIFFQFVSLKKNDFTNDLPILITICTCFSVVNGKF